jgi:hypothetical protein
MMSWMIMAEQERHTAAAYTTESPEEMQHEDHFTQIHTRPRGAPALVAKVLILSNYFRVIDGKIVSPTPVRPLLKSRGSAVCRFCSKANSNMPKQK